jgi:hypothetical protein
MKHIRIVFLHLLCLCIFTTTALAQLLLTEDFDYPVGDSLKLHGWMMTGSAASYSYLNPVSVTAPGLEYSGYRGSGVGNAASLASTGQDVCRPFANPASAGSVYAFLMVRVSAARSSGDYFFHLIGGPPTSSAFAPKLSVKSGDAKLAFGISKRANAGSATYTGFNYGIDTTYLIVLKYRFISDAATDDEVSLYVFEPGALPGAEPSQAAAGPVTEASSADLDSVCCCALRQGSSSAAPTVTVDGIRVTTTWESILPIQLSSFRGVLEDAGTVTLTWTTQSEIDNYGFQVERSANSTDGFVAISPLIPGHNTTVEPQTYNFTDHGVPNGKWFYRLKSIAMDQSVSYSAVVEVSNTTTVDQTVDAPREYRLMQNYPNPFNPSTRIKYTVGGTGVLGLGSSNIKVVIYDLMGRQVAVLVDEKKAPGNYEVSFDGKGLSSGVYIYRLTAGNYIASRRMVLVK